MCRETRVLPNLELLALHKLQFAVKIMKENSEKTDLNRYYSYMIQDEV